MNRQYKLAILHTIVFTLIFTQYATSNSKFEWLDNGLYDIDLSNENGVVKVVDTSSRVFFVLLLCFPFITALFHLGRGSGLLNSPIFRFIEYAITSSIMLYLLAISCGVMSFNDIIMLVTVNSCLMLIGCIIQLRLSDGGSESGYLTAIAWTLFTVSWLPLARSFFTAIDKLYEQDVLPPNLPSRATFQAMFYGLFAFFTSFGVVQTAEVFNCISRDSADISYDILSATSKTTLVGLIAGGFFNR